MNILILGSSEYKEIISQQGFGITIDPADATAIISDATAIQNIPDTDIPLAIILTNSIADWSAKQKHPQALFVTSIAETMPWLNSLRPQVVQTTYKDRLFILTHSNKGGVGKTSTAIALAEVLSQKAKTILCDFDYTAPDIGTFYNIKPQNYFESPVSPVRINDNLYTLPSPKNVIPSSIKGSQVYDIVQSLSNFQIIIGDTPPAPWDKPYLHKLFASCDIVFSVVDQSLFSVDETRRFAPTLIAMGVNPGDIKIIVNRYSPRQASIKVIEQAFCGGFKKGVSNLPKVAAIIPEDWDSQLDAVNKRKILNKDAWEKVCHDIFERLGIENTEIQETTRGFFDVFKKIKFNIF